VFSKVSFIPPPQMRELKYSPVLIAKIAIWFDFPMQLFPFFFSTAFSRHEMKNGRFRDGSGHFRIFRMKNHFLIFSSLIIAR
jgi:hypothetical protein